MKIIVPLAVASALLAGCATSGNSLNTPQAMEIRTEVDAELAYQTSINGFNALLAAGKITKAEHDADWNRAWDDLQSFRTLYNSGQNLTTAVTALQADVQASKGTP